jgi:predicted metalloprotease with PDZ domain
MERLPKPIRANSRLSTTTYSAGDWEAQVATPLNIIDERYSISIMLGTDGALRDVVAGSAADRAGLAPKMKLLAVNTRRFSPETLERAIEAAKKITHPIQLLAENGEFLQTFDVNYHSGLRYSKLERDTAKPDLLSAILKPALESPTK